ncbi:hypothetical protein PIB30_114333, partial [Stylosanthes scabra]|nr:hypothetical protein [Stylosanthes scabra]
AFQVWQVLRIHPLLSESGEDLSFWIHKNCKENPAIFTAGVWWIWRARNNDIFDNDDHWDTAKVVALCRHSAREFNVLHYNLSFASSPTVCL